MKLVIDTDVDRIVLKEKDEKEIVPKQTLIVAKSGHGKTLALERGIYNYWKNGFNIIIINDAKNLLELAFIGFPKEIIANYHRKALKYQNLEPSNVNVKIFHTFTFNLPKQKIPETRFFSLPITALSDSEIRFLIEDTEDKSTRELLLSALNNINYFDSLWDYLLSVETLIERRTQMVGSQEKKLPDPNRFGLSGVSTGSVKNIDEVARIFERFQTHMFLMPENFELNLDIGKELFENQQEIKIFSTRYIKDQKTKDFVILMLLNAIVKNAHKSKNPILIVLDEIKDLVPSSYSRTGYKSVLAKEIAHLLNTEFRANNIASISTSQSFAGINKNLLKTNAFTETFIGAIEGDTDLLNLKQIFLYDKKILDTIQSLDFNQFLVRGISDLPIAAQEENPFKCLFAPWPHKEPSYKFDDLFEKYYPEKMNKYSELINKMQSLKESYIKKNMEIKELKIKKEFEESKKLQNEKEQNKELKKQVEELTIEKKQSNSEKIKERDEQIWNLRNELTQKELALKFKISQPMVNAILKKKVQEVSDG